MSPEYLRELADSVDPDQLWRALPYLLGGKRLTKKQKRQCDIGVALRRYASHIEALNLAFVRRQSLLITPLSRNSSAHKLVAKPAAHKKLRR